MLAVFVADLGALLDRVAMEPRDLIYVPHRDRLRAAWLELGRTEPFEHLAYELRSAEIDDELELRGLTGAQLRLKLEGFYLWVEREQVRELPLEAVGRWRQRRRRKWFRRALRWADIPLGSLSSIPAVGTVADAIVEIKDSFLEASEDRDA